MDIAAWLRELGLERYERAFRENDIASAVLSEVTDQDLQKLGVSLGHRRLLLKAIRALAEDQAAHSPAENAHAPDTPPQPRLRPEAERRQLTVLFCDLVGSTELSTRLDPEDMGAVVGAYQRATAAVIECFKGHVPRFLGDGVLAYFGWPRANEDDAERAVRAGLQLVEAVAGLEPRAEVRLQARVGIATGQVVIGDLVGEGATRDEAVVGETPNLAARLQALAEPGTVVISQSTRRLIGGMFELDDLGSQPLKGFAEPLAVWRVTGESRAECRFEARHAAGLTPLVGRDEELSLLLCGWELAKDGEGQVVLLSGEPGIGKSRLVRELRDYIAAESHLQLTFQCSPYHQASPLHPVIEQLERAAAFKRDDPPEAKLDKLEALLARGTDELDQTVPLIADLLGLPTADRYPPLDVTPQRQKQRTLEVLVDQLEGLAAEQPVLLAYEDVHWIDPTTQELLGLAIERIQRLPVLVIITFRPEFSPPWSGQPHVTALSLTRLGRRDGAAMVDRVVGQKALPDEIARQIVAKTDGVPLFVEELTKAVLESGLLAIPATLHDSLLARLDHVAPAKEVAQIGAAIGREFSHALLAAVADWPEAELHAALDQLVHSELIFRRGAPPDATYSFKHVLVQDAAYETLLKSRRPQLHARIAKVLEEEFPEKAEAQPELLAHHWTQAAYRAGLRDDRRAAHDAAELSAERARLVKKAIQCWYNAARQAMARPAMVEAAVQLTQARDLMADLPRGADRDRLESDLQIDLCAALITTKGGAVPEVERAYARARELCKGEDQYPRLLANLYKVFVDHLNWSSKEVALQIAGELLRLTERQQDVEAQVVGHRCLAESLLLNGQLLLALIHSKQALDLYDQADRASPVHWGGPNPRVQCLLFTALILLFQGRQKEALALKGKALAAAYELDHALTTSQAFYWTAWFHQVRREQRYVEERTRALIGLAKEHRLSAWAAKGAVLHGWAVGEGGAAETGLAELREGLRATQAIGVQQHTPGFLGLLAGLQIRTNKSGEALQVLEEALAWVDRLEERWFEADLLRLKGEALLACSPECAAQAEACYHKALAVARMQGARLWELRAAMSLARLWRDQGRRAEARDLLAPIYGLFTEAFDTADLKDAKALLDELR